jgi:choice-of-anchor C domain-containing protein
VRRTERTFVVKRRSLLGGLTAAVVSLALAGTVLAAGISNGSFESGNYVDGGFGFQTLAAGSTTITGWTVGGAGVDWISTYWTAQDGNMSLDLNALLPGSISQTFATSPNNTYAVQFYLAGNPASGPATRSLTVSATGATSQAFTFDMTGTSLTAMGWAVQQYNFVATSASTTLTFTADAANTTPYGPALDNVTVTETAATGAMCKNGGWRTMHDTSGTPFKNQGACVSFYATSGQTPIGAPLP